MRKAFVLFLLLTACGSPTASEDLLMGVWGADFDATWDISREKFLKDTMRGADAYSKDEAEKEEQVKKEARELLSDYTMEFGKDGKATMKAMGRSMEGTWKVLSTDGSSLKLETKLGRKQTIDVEFENDDTAIFTLGEKMTLVLTRR